MFVQIEYTMFGLKLTEQFLENRQRNMSEASNIAKTYSA